MRGNSGRPAAILLAACLAASLAGAAPPQGKDASSIPADRLIEWRPGVPGGIPPYPVFSRVKDAPYGARGDGQADDTAAIQKALDACPPGKAVHVPAGTYRLTGELRITKGIVLRGDGPEKTRLINEAVNNSIIGICNFDEEEVRAKITGGATKGSASVAVDNASRFAPGDMVLIDQLNDPELVDIRGCGGACTWAGRDGGRRAMGQLVQVEARQGNVLTLSRTLYATFKEALAPEVFKTRKTFIARAGIEDLYLEGKTPKRTDQRSSIRIWNSLYCWVRNVESHKGWFGGHVTLQKSLGCEIRDSYFHHANAFGAGHGYGVWLFAGTTDALVENNVFYTLNSGVLAECSGPGNVVGYNFCSRFFGRDYPDTDWAYAGMGTHGAHCWMNLFEGNVTPGFSGDFYWGSASHNVLLRNRVDMDQRMADGRPMPMAVIAMRWDQRNHFITAAGNVLGHEKMQGVLEGGPEAGLDRRQIWRLGYHAPSSGGVPADPKVAQTLLRHGNFDYVSGRTQWDPGIPGRQLPRSLYLNAKPEFFGKLRWPAFGPDLEPMAGPIPAQERFLRMPAPEREAQDLLFRGEFLLAAGREKEGREALRQVVSRFGHTSYAAEARSRLEPGK